MALRALGLALVLLAFSPVLSNDFVSWDDPEVLIENEALRSDGVAGWAFRTTRMSHFQPLSWLVWRAAGDLLGMEPRVFHGLSILVHVLNAAMLYLVILTLWPARLPALAASLLYTVHPLRVEAVAWASAFPYLLSTSFLLASALLYLRGFSAGSALAYAGSMLARPIAVLYPLVLFALDLARGRRVTGALEKLPFFAIAIAGLALEARSRRFLDLEAYGAGERLTLFADSLLSNLLRTLWPVGLTPLDPLPLEPRTDVPLILLAATALAGAGALVFRARRRLPAAPALFLSWILLAVPSLGLAPSGLQATADRYSYVPGLALAAAVGAVLVRAPKPVLLAAAAAALLLGGATHRQCQWWKDSATLWGRAVELDPKNDLALYFLASALLEAGRLDHAEARYRQLLELIPDHGPARKDLARIQARRADALAAGGSLAGAVELYDAALRNDPHLGPSLSERRGMALFQLGRLEEAATPLEAAVRGGAPSPEVASAYALLLASGGRNEEAASFLKRSLERFPEDVGLLHNLARLLATSDLPGREDEALALAERVVEKTGGADPRALDTLGFALASRGAIAEAASVFEKASRLARSQGDPDLAREIDSHARALER